MKRISHQEEMNLMLPASNMRNIQNFSKILNNFYYNDSTNKRVLQNLSPLSKSFPDNFLDQKFQLNSQFRAFYKLDTNEDNDPAYLSYMRFLYDNCMHIKSWHEAYKEMGGLQERMNGPLRNPDEYEKKLFKQLEVAEEFDVLNYEIFCSGKLTVGKDERKLFRFCLQNELLTRAQVDRLNVLKTKGGLYVCLSRNPVDYIFVSTNQSYTSCLNLESEAEGCFWMGLGGLIVDPSRFLVFVTNGKILRYQVKGLEFKHFKYTSRSWGIISKHEELCLVNAYPADKIRMKDKLVEAGYKVLKHSDHFKQSLINHELPRHQDGSESTIYLDNVGISCRNEDKRKNGRTWYYTDDGTTGSLSEFDYDGTFENVGCFDDLMHEMRSCDYCGERYHEENGFYLEHGGGVCGYCYDEYHFTCRYCRSVYHNDEAEYHNDQAHCSYCFRQNVRTCHGCAETVSRNDGYTVSGWDYCPDCYNKEFFECCHCSVPKPHDECGPKDYTDYCQVCYDEVFDECAECGTVEEAYLLSSYEDERICWSCIEEKEKE